MHSMRKIASRMVLLGVCVLLVLPLSLSYDHRVIDGAVGARYLGAVRDALERPLALMA